MDLAKVVSTGEAYPWREGQLDLDRGMFVQRRAEVQGRGLRLRREAQHPAHAGRARLRRDRGAGADPAAEVLALKPDGVFLSNGPGDPAPCDYAIAAIRDFIARKIPTFGICLGHQLLALASGARP
jgi:carbamoyl-phosphate synthase small subunit